MFTALIAAARVAIPLVERLIASTPEKKGGVDRKDLVRQMLRAVAEKLIARGESSGEVPADDSLNGVIETVFQSMKTSGELTAPVDTRDMVLLMIRGDVKVVNIGELSK